MSERSGPVRIATPANLVTLVRAGGTGGILAALALGRLDAPSWGLTLGALALVLLDGLDGWLARRTGTASAFGARFDLEVDAALIAALALAVFSLERAGAWVLAGGLARYVFVLAARPWPWLARPLPPSRRRQSACVVQTIALIIALTPAVAPPASDAIAALGVSAVLLSFGADAWWLKQRR